MISLRAQSTIEWVSPAGCPSGFQTVKVHAGRSDEPRDAPIEIVRDEARTNREKVDSLHEFVTETGIPMPVQPRSLPPIREDDSRVVCRMAVRPEEQTDAVR